MINGVTCLGILVTTGGLSMAKAMAVSQGYFLLLSFYQLKTTAVLPYT